MEIICHVCIVATLSQNCRNSDILHYYFIQYILSVAPVRLAACQKRIKRLGMIMVFQVAKLMHDDVLDTMDGRFYQV
jgi:hypothetical protein